MAQVNSWVFTLANPKRLLDESIFGVNLRYLAYSEELGEGGLHHFQGYVEFARSVRLPYVRKILPKAHWEPRRGTPEEARAYACKLDETHLSGPYEWYTYGSSAWPIDISDDEDTVNEDFFDMPAYDPPLIEECMPDLCE